MGVIMNNNLSFSTHNNQELNYICKKKKLYYRDDINGTHSEIPQSWLKMFVNALVISRLDYCKSVLYGVPKYQRDKHQRV